MVQKVGYCDTGDKHFVEQFVLLLFTSHGLVNKDTTKQQQGALGCWFETFSNTTRFTQCLQTREGVEGDGV